MVEAVNEHTNPSGARERIMEIIYSDRRLIEKIVSMVHGMGAHGRWLDMPSGGGALSRRLSASGRGLVEADRDPAGDLGGRRIVRLDMNTFLPFSSRSFDGVACIEGIEHVENSFSLLREIRRILKPGGTLILSTPNVLKLGSRLHFFLTGFPHYLIRPNPEAEDEQDPFPHIHMLPYHELRYALHTQGMRIRAIATNRVRFNDALLLPLWPVAAFFTWRRLRRERRPDQHRRNREVLRDILSWKMLFGNILIMVIERTDAE